MRELSEFLNAAEEQGGINVGDKARIFKVLKTPVPLDKTPPELKMLLGYEFFSIDPETGKVRELDEVFGPEAQREFWIELDDLAHDIVKLLEMIHEARSSTRCRDPSPDVAGRTHQLSPDRRRSGHRASRAQHCGVNAGVQRHGLSGPDDERPARPADRCAAICRSTATRWCRQRSRTWRTRPKR